MTARKGHPTSDGWAPPVNIRLPDFKRSNEDEFGNVVEDERGDPLVTHPKTGEMVSYWAPSSYGTVLENLYNLHQWLSVQAIIGTAANKAIQAEIAAAAAVTDEKERKKRLNKLVRKAIDLAGGSDAARLGTALHELVEQVNRGKPATTFDSFTDNLAAYTACLKDNGLEVLPGWVEVNIVNDQFKRAGTFDMILRRKSDGLLIVSDVKTGKNADYPKPAYLVQQYLYATGQAYDTRDNTRHPLPDGVSKDIALLVALPAETGGCELLELDLGIGKRACDDTKYVRQWHYRKDFLRPYRPPTGPTLTAVPDPPPAFDIDEGDELTDEQRNELKAMFDQLGDSQATVGRWIIEARKAGRDWRVAPPHGQPTERRYWIARAAMAWAPRGNEDAIWAGLSLVLDGDTLESIGATLGVLTIAEAKDLHLLANTPTSALTPTPPPAA